MFQFDIPPPSHPAFSSLVLLPLAGPGYPGLQGSAATSTSWPPFEVPLGLGGLAGQTLGLDSGGHLSHNCLAKNMTIRLCL